MNTKFDVGQRVTYPVVHTADGAITGIAVSKAGVTRYAIGPKWYTEDDLKLAVEEKPDIGNPIAEPVKEGKPEPVKLYCVKDYKPGEWFTKGKIYESSPNGSFAWDDGYSSEFIRNAHFFNGVCEGDCLVPLARRPAKVGEWVIATNKSGHGVPINTPVCVKEILEYTKYIEVDYTQEHGCNVLRPDQYLVLDGYTGDPA